MKHLQTFESAVYIKNLVKNKKFPTYRETRGYDRKSTYNDSTDYYFIYKLSKSEIGKYLNLWFEGSKTIYKDEVTQDEMISVVKVNKETANNLYQRNYNPISINILRFSNKYDMKAAIHSIDDSSYGIWFNIDNYDELIKIRFQLIKEINILNENKRGLDGKLFIDKCIELGANPESVDYN